MAPRSFPKTAEISQVVPFLSVTDMTRSLRFYVDDLDFEMKRSWVVEGNVKWCWLTRGGASIMLQQFNPDRPGEDPDVRRGAGVSLNFVCDDAIALYEEARSRGIAASEPEVGNSMWYTVFADPDGYKLDFESVTDVAEDTTLTEYRGSGAR